VLKRRSFIDGGGSYTVEFKGLHLSVAIVDSAHGFFYALAINGIVADQPGSAAARKSTSAASASTCREELSWSASMSSYQDPKASEYQALAGTSDDC